MALQVTLVKTPGNIALSRNKHVFDQRGGTFGRADSNTWVLPDPEKFLSSCHCEIVFADNLFFLEDRSTNGTFINGSFEPLGRGTRHQLRDGDFFEIGDFRFSIQLLQQTHAPEFSPSFASPFDLETGESNSAFLGDPHKADFFGQGIAEAPPLFDQQQDPLALWDKRPQMAPSPFSSLQDPGLSRGHNSLLDDFVGIDKPVNEPLFTSVNVAPGLDQAVAWPTAKAEGLIPEDWADDLLGPAPSQSPLPVRSAPMPDPLDALLEAELEADSIAAFAPKPTVQPVDAPFEIPKPAARIPLAERILGMESLAEKPPVTTPFNHPVRDVPVATEAPPVSKSSPTISPAPNTPVRGSSLDRTLAEALGLDMSRLSEQDLAEISRVTGLLMREIVDGMLGVLRSRASIKNEFRMNVTTIQPIENNPLKFSVCVDDALENLFIKKSNAYKKPIEAFREGFQEIAEHQLAMIAGIRQGFEAMMERFNPEQLEKTFSKQVKGSVIPGMQKAKFWNSYTEYYQGLTDNMEFSFQHLFGSDFVSAYEDQLRRLTAARKRGDSNDE